MEKLKAIQTVVMNDNDENLSLESRNEMVSTFEVELEEILKENKQMKEQLKEFQEFYNSIISRLSNCQEEISSLNDSNKRKKTSK